MKPKSKTAARLVAAIMFVALSAGLLVAGIPALAESPEIVPVIAQNASPIAKNLEYATFRGIGISGQLTATDPEGDALTYEVTVAPKKGAVEVKSDGSFFYTPKDGKRGTDTFKYEAVDSYGNRSETATVTIDIQKQSTKITYSDMAGSGSHYSALVLAEEGVFLGEKLGSEYFFRPDTPVTRGEFLAMCLGITDADMLEGITRTGFYDDATIPMWVKPYVSTGLMAGVISGYRDQDGRLVFSPAEPITFSEAAVILNNVLELSNVVCVMSAGDDAAPVWACQAEANLTACNVMPGLGLASYYETVTRAEAADMLAASLALLSTRDKGVSLLSWANP